MAYYGLRKPYIAKYNSATKSYSDGFKCGEAMTLNITPNYKEASLYGDDAQVEYVKVFTNATISLGTTRLPFAAASVMFGHTVNAETKEVTFKGTDEPNYVGVGAIAPEIINKVTQYTACIILCAKFSEGQDSFTTQGENITFSTPTVDGSAVIVEDDVWKKVKTFETEASAVAWVKEFLNITDDDSDDESDDTTPDTSEDGE